PLGPMALWEPPVPVLPPPPAPAPLLDEALPEELVLPVLLALLLELLVADVHVPPMQAPPGQAAPSGFAGLEQVPMAGSHVPTSWQASLAAQVTGLPPLQTPPEQVSVWVQAQTRPDGEDAPATNWAPGVASGVAIPRIRGQRLEAGGQGQTGGPLP